MATYQGHNEDASGNILLNIGNGMTATVELGSTASQAYTKGAYLFFNNRFCKATSAIASGTTLAIGTNLSETTIGTELTSHLRSSDGKEFYFDVKDGSYGYYPSASKTASEFVPFGGSGVESIDVVGMASSIGTYSQAVVNGEYYIFAFTYAHGDGKVNSGATVIDTKTDSIYKAILFKATSNMISYTTSGSYITASFLIHLNL